MAERFVVTGGNRLSGEVAVGGAKNSVLKQMAATLLAEGTSTITNCPDILDVPLMAEVLRGLGATVELDGDLARITSPDEWVDGTRYWKLREAEFCGAGSAMTGLTSEC